MSKLKTHKEYKSNIKMSCLYKVFAACSDVVNREFEKLVEVVEESEAYLESEAYSVESEIKEHEIPEVIKMDKNSIVLAKFNDNEILFLTSEDDVNFFLPVVKSKIVDDVKLTWFDEEGKPKEMLFKELSVLSNYQKNFHEPLYFKSKIKKVYFRYINKQISPYRYSTKMT